MMEKMTLNAGAASAELWPSRGGLLGRLALVAPGGTPVDLLHLPEDFDPAASGWPGGGAPLLFPFAGRVFHHGTPLFYEWGSEVRAMPLHGFAYGARWTVEKQAADQVNMRLVSNPATQMMFPYDFDVDVNYLLSPASLTLTLTAKNLGPRDGAPPQMPISAGWHPYFRLPEHGLATMRLDLKAGERIAVTPAGAAGKSSPIPEGTDFSGTAPWLANQIIGKLEGSRVSLIDQGAGRAIDVAWDDALTQYIVVWTGDPSQYYCVEPWMGTPDAVSTGLGLSLVEPGESLTVRWRLALRAV